MSMRMWGIVMLGIGIALVGFGLNSTQAITEKAMEGVTGRYTNHTMLYLIGGIALIISGGALAISNFQKK